MKREDIDKRIGMPDVDAEWVRFEHEVIDQKKGLRKAVYWSMGIAASIALAVGLVLSGHDMGQPQQSEPREMIASAMHPDMKFYDDRKRLRQTKHDETTAAETQLALDLDTTHRSTVPDRENPATPKAKKKPLTKTAHATTTPYEQIPGLEEIIKTHKPLGHGGTMRLRGNTSSNVVRDTALFIIDGQSHIMPLKEEWGLCGIERDLYHRRLLIDCVEVYKDDNNIRPYIEKYGEAAKGGVVIIKTAPDTLCDAYVRQHPELIQVRHRVEGYVLDADTDKPLADAWVSIGNGFTGAATDSAGHFILWLPHLDTTLRTYCTGYHDTEEIRPSDTILTIRMKPYKGGFTMRLN